MSETPRAAAAPNGPDVDTPADAPVLAVRRLVSASPERIFAAFADPEQVDRWFGPEGFRHTTHEHDFRRGGVWRHTLHGPDGTDYPNRSVFVTIEAPHEIVWDQGWDDAGSAPLHRSSITLREQDRGTEVELRLVFPTMSMRDEAVHGHGAVEGAQVTLARLAAHVTEQPQPRRTHD